MFDFFPIPSEFLRSLYYRGIDVIQKFVRKNVDEIWYTTPRLLECDRERFGKLPKNVVKRLVHGCFFRRIKIAEPPSPPPLRLAFLGSLRRDTGIYESLEAISKCIRNHIRVELSVIGSGPKEKELIELTKNKKIHKAVKFYGFEDREEKIAKIFSKCHLGLALYPARPYSPNWYLTSGKFRRYISQRLPVVASTIPYFTKYIYDYRAGVIVDNEPQSIYEALQKIYNNPLLLTSMRRGVDRLYNVYKADVILEQAFSAMLSHGVK